MFTVAQNVATQFVQQFTKLKWMFVCIFMTGENLGGWDTNYSCKKCGLMVQTKSSPSSSGCTEASFHDWRKQ